MSHVNTLLFIAKKKKLHTVEFQHNKPQDNEDPSTTNDIFQPVIVKRMENNLNLTTPIIMNTFSHSLVLQVPL